LKLVKYHICLELVGLGKIPIGVEVWYIAKQTFAKEKWLQPLAKVERSSIDCLRLYEKVLALHIKDCPYHQNSMTEHLEEEIRGVAY
jgi:GDP-D-mannose dehydratase